MDQTHLGLSDLTRHYVQSSLASGVLLALSRCRRDGQLINEDRIILRRASEFLKELENGDAFRTGRQTNPQMLHGGITLEEALSGLPREYEANIGERLTAFQEFIDQLLVAPDMCVTEERFDLLYDFMKGIRDLQRNLIGEALHAPHAQSVGIPAR